MTPNEKIKALHSTLTELRNEVLVGIGYTHTDQGRAYVKRIDDLLAKTNPDALQLGTHAGKVAIPVAVLEFYEHGRAIWVHDQNGCTILRVAVRKGITLDDTCINPSAHVDIEVEGPVKVCVPKESLETYYDE